MKYCRINVYQDYRLSLAAGLVRNIPFEKKKLFSISCIMHKAWWICFSDVAHFEKIALIKKITFQFESPGGCQSVFQSLYFQVVYRRSEVGSGFKSPSAELSDRFCFFVQAVS